MDDGGNRSPDETRCSKLGPFVLQTDFAQIPIRSTSYRRVGRRAGSAGMIGHRAAFSSVPPFSSTR